MDNPNIVTAIRRSLIANGFQPVAVKTGEKAPLGMAWQMRRGLPQLSDAALNTGILCEGLCPADIDVGDADAVEAIVKIFDEVAGHSSLRRTRPNSSHCLLFYRAPDGARPKKRVIKLGSLGKVEFLGLGQQFVAYGMHPSGVEFEWPEAGPDIVKREDMLILTPEHEAEIERRLRATFDLPADEPATPQPDPIATSRAPAAQPAPGPDTGARERAAFKAALADEVRKVAQAGEGQRNHTLNVAAFSLAQMVASGWGGQSEVDTALTEAAFACGLRQPEIRKTIASGFASGSKKPRAALDDRAGYGDAGPEIEIRLTKVNGVTIVADTGEIVEDAGDEPDEEEVGEAPPIDEALTHVDGVLGEVIDFIVATSRRPNRRLALSAALPLCATLLGRRMATPTGAGLQLYVIATYPTGGGKQHQLDAIDRLMRASELQRHVGPSQFMSMSALVKHVAASPLTICAQDEFGALLKRLSHPRASTHEQGISMVLRSLWGSNFATVRTPAYASTSSVEIAAPCLSLYGPTTPEELYEALRGRDVVNGFLNRFLVIDGGERVAEVEPRRKLRDVSDSLRDGMMRLYRAGTTGRGNLSGYVCKNTAPDPEGLHARWQDQRAEDIYRDLSSTAQRRIDADAETGQFMARVAEIAVRCATIRACGRDPDIPTVTGDDMDWAAALVWQSTERLIGDAGRFMVDPLGAAEFERKLLAKVHSAGPRGVRMRELHRAMSRYQRFANDLRNTLDALSRSGMIVVDERKVAGGLSRRVRIA